jgi:N-acetylglucosaminyldiphosphoundecaprenol N-acetyl-beta-D-mannosaminyltransferase
MRRVGLEWLYRLLREPWRWRRQSVLPRYVGLVLRQRFGARR